MCRIRRCTIRNRDIDGNAGYQSFMSLKFYNNNDHDNNNNNKKK